jgi:excinuclease ABC subunit A
VIVIEHNLDVIKSADWLIDLGPEGGTGGGGLVVEGPPELVAATPESYTGRFLRPLLERSRPANSSTEPRARTKPTVRRPPAKVVIPKKARSKASA